MLSLFLNPWTFIAGGLLVSAPIIIHLINRIRFRRVKWAAMEFLLKAQKRMRRRKILEQLLLLLLRCLLVFLVGVLFARFLGCNQGSGQETRPTSHLVILDDTPSMADAWRREDGTPTDALTEGKRLVYEKLMPAAGEATTAQTFQVIRLSDLGKVFPEKRDDAKVSARTIETVEGYLKPLQVSPVRKSLLDGLRKANEVLGQAPATDAKVIHVITDLRSVDWAQEGEAVSELLRELKDNGATVHFIDVVNPARKAERKTPQANDNISIIEVKPRNRVVAANQQTDIEVRLKNFGGTDLKEVRVDFFLNGVKDVIPSLVFPSLPAGQERTLSVQGTFTQTATREKPLDRFNLVTAALGTPDVGGLTFDNARHAVVEVRPKLQVLVVEGRPEKRESPKGDSFYLRKLFIDSFGGVEWVTTEAPKLEVTDLRPYTTIYLLNVPSLTENAVKNIERFVADGGGVGIFLGPDVKPDDYTARLYRGGQGFFPVPLPKDGFSKELTQEQKLARELAFSKRIILRDPGNRQHPALFSIYNNDRGAALKEIDDVERFFYFTNIDLYWPIARRGGWREDQSVKELYCLPNEKQIAEFEDRSRTLVSEIKKKWGEPKFEKARKYLAPLLQRIESTPSIQNERLSTLARYLDQLLCDQINDGDESEPVLRDFWSQPELVEVKPKAMELRDEAKYGDPFYLVKQYGKGRVAVITTDAGGTHTGDKLWTDWPSLKGSPGWVVVVSEMQRYLAGGGADGNLSLGERYFAEFEAGRYKPETIRHLLTIDVLKGGAAPTLTLKELGPQPLDTPSADPGAAPDAPRRPYQLAYADAKVPGAYLFTLTRLRGEKDPPGTPAEQPDYAATTFNPDANREGDLRRANTDDFLQVTNKAPLYNTEDLSWIDTFKQKPSDYSSRRWLYLLILLVLIAEQAWAVRISYHSKPEDLENLAPSAAAAFAHHTTAPPASAGDASDANTPTTVA